MKIKFDTKLTYIPKWNGNREADPDDQILVTFKNPTVSMKNRLSPKPELKFSYDAEGNVQGGETTINQPRKTLIDAMLVKIDNLSFEEDGEEKRVTGAKTLWDAPSEVDGLIDELAEHFRKELDKKVDEKN